MTCSTCGQTVVGFKPALTLPGYEFFMNLCIGVGRDDGRAAEGRERMGACRGWFGRRGYGQAPVAGEPGKAEKALVHFQAGGSWRSAIPEHIAALRHLDGPIRPEETGDHVSRQRLLRVRRAGRVVPLLGFERFILLEALPYRLRASAEPNEDCGFKVGGRNASHGNEYGTKLHRAKVSCDRPR